MDKEEIISYKVFFETLVQVIDENRFEEVKPVLRNYANKQINLLTEKLNKELTNVEGEQQNGRK